MVPGEGTGLAPEQEPRGTCRNPAHKVGQSWRDTALSGDRQPGHMAVQSPNGSLSHLKTNCGPESPQGPFQGQKSFDLTWNFHD